jgi:hypothetical protein
VRMATPHASSLPREYDFGKDRRAPARAVVVMKLLARASTVGMRNCPGCESSNLPCMIDRMAGIVTVREQFERLGFIVGHVGERPIGVEVTVRILSNTA